MKIYDITDPRFLRYGSIVQGYDFSDVIRLLKEIPIPEDVEYVASLPELEELPLFEQFEQGFYHGIPVELGYCMGHNQKLNALEYHVGSEVNIAATDYIVLIGSKQDMDEDYRYDTKNIEAFYVHEGMAVEFYDTTLHYCACNVTEEGYAHATFLPKGTNLPLDEGFVADTEEDRLLTARNKWMLVHEDGGFPSSVPVKLTGENIEISSSDWGMPQESEKKVIVIGSLNYDVCLKQEHIPEEGETCFADKVDYCSGGKGANQAVQAAKLGLSTYMTGCIGDDSQGPFLKETIESYGVRTCFLKTVPDNSGMSVAQSLYDGGVRASVVRGANDWVTTEDVDALGSYIHEGDIVVMQLEIPIPVVEYAVKFCKDHGAKVILNAAPAAPLSEKTRKLVDIFIVNEVEAGFYCGEELGSIEMAEKEIEKQQKEQGGICIWTLGKDGALVCDGEECRHIPPKKVKAVESTGAGDSFIGGLCYGLMNDMDIFEAARFASCCGAKTIGRTGGQPAMPFLGEVMELYREG